jgi:HAMP domain-containing protein
VPQKTAQTKSISSTFQRALFLIYLVSTLVAVPIVYLLTKEEIYSQANKELKLLVDVVNSARAIVRERTRPHFLPKKEFFPPVVSSTVMAKELATHFKKLQPDYLIRMVSDNPLNQDNLPVGFETKVLRTLRYGSNKEKIELTGDINGRTYLISATATKVKGSCLLCHGNPQNAPTEITDQYGTTSGFGWKTGAIIGTSLVGVPVTDLNWSAFKRSSIIIGIITALFAIVMIVLNRVVKRKIIEPILKITDASKEISLGRSNRAISTDRNDEIGALARSFELMRRSINIAAKQLAKANSRRKK